ncbi:hypothetical protein J2S43_001645 [Catenuloplanes nepalensis]|uniref:Uncharacterized protein n=1 Tax=Catenuloplanes nepalensis TaxID=587533 RepID=A0ABT9MNW3_9ACTN|nr:hypothetical protein [Catenuloplanes nepalensis]MDP9793133.1 hypothetical protein [Catenuloplanes nepalensis]
MSGSPKYTNVRFDAARQAQLEAARRRREAERRQRAEQARQRRIAAGAQAARDRAGAVTARLEQLGAAARGLTQEAHVAAALSDVRAVAATLAAHLDEAAVKQAGRRLRDAEKASDRLGTAVARELTGRRHDAALAAAIAPLAQVTDRVRLDREGHDRVAAMIGEAESRAGDERRFPDAVHRLGGAVQDHLERVRDRLAQLSRLAGETDEAVAGLHAAFSDADRNDVPVDGRAELDAALRDLEAERDGAHVSRWRHRLGEVRRATEELTTRVTERLDQLDRMAIVVEAASAALPAAGLRVIDGSLVETGESVSFRALRSDGNPIELTVHAGDGRGTRLEYRVDGADVVVEHTAEGAVSRCELTEDLLERFHEKLGAEGVRADGVHWAGKPAEPRPPSMRHAGGTARQARSTGGER